jgi:hypothetical protein
MKNLTLKQKVAQYEAFLHKINMACTCMDNLAIQELVQNADAWSYSHRQGNGMLSEKEQQELINAKFFKLCDTPKAIKAREELKQKRKDSLNELTKQAQELNMGY